MDGWMGGPKMSVFLVFLSDLCCVLLVGFSLAQGKAGNACS